MAHFAKLNDNNVVVEVHVVNNDALDPNNEEASGVAFLTDWSGGYSNWKQTSYNGTFRKNYAGIGYTFDGVGFAPPQPFLSWTLNTSSYLWEAPIPMPEDSKAYNWNEKDQLWVELVPPTE